MQGRQLRYRLFTSQHYQRSQFKDQFAPNPLSDTTTTTTQEETRPTSQETEGGGGSTEPEEKRKKSHLTFTVQKQRRRKLILDELEDQKILLISNLKRLIGSALSFFPLFIFILNLLTKHTKTPPRQLTIMWTLKR
jgi:hypothetical protein